MITETVEASMMLLQLNKWHMIGHSIHLIKNLKKKWSRLIAELLIQLHLMIFNVRFVGTTLLPPRIHYSTVARVQDQSDTSITSA